MSIKQRLEGDLKAAMKTGDKPRVDCLRMLRARIQEREVALRADKGRDYQLTDDEVIRELSAYAKQRRDSIESYAKGGRQDLVSREEAELAIVGEYLPAQLADDELREIVRGAVAECGATSAADMGAVMRAVMARVRGAADGKRVSAVVREILAG